MNGRTCIKWLNDDLKKSTYIIENEISKFDIDLLSIFKILISTFLIKEC